MYFFVYEREKVQKNKIRDNFPRFFLAIGEFLAGDFVLHFYFYPLLKQPDGKMVL